MYNKKYNFPVFTLADVPCHYDNKKLSPGFYYIEKKDLKLGFIQLGNIVANESLTRFLLKKKLITKDNIKYQLRASCSIPCDVYRNVIEWLYEKFDEKIAKQMINFSIGCWNRKQTLSTFATIFPS